jgi:hypothetical protein
MQDSAFSGARRPVSGLLLSIHLSSRHEPRIHKSMLRRLLSVALFIAPLVLAGCGSTAPTQGTMRERIGTTTARDAIEQTRQVLLNTYNYRFDREVTTQEDIRFITLWSEHAPLEGEQAKGITGCRTRLEVHARPKNRSSGSPSTYTVIFRSEYQVQKQGGAQWVDAEMTEAREEYIEEIVQDLEDAMASGVRTR